MKGVTLTLRVLHSGERHMVRQLTAVAERHRVEHEVHHVALDLAGWSRTHVQRLADAAAHHGVDLDESAATPLPHLLSMLVEKASEAAGRRPEPGLLLLRDVRELHLAAAENSLHWEMLAQTAQASRDGALLDVVSACHPETLRQMRWTNTMIKTLSAQILTSL
ncbi:MULTISPECIES: hypothetical protein [Streptomyces]|uniref:hypothetical protein n=1 Tax=Streptomyces TaxID=1883 RepID=UPI0029BE9F20|nr:MULTISPECIES: hypothetical protein [unclassified Streptomyces]MDX3092841.1 hypothetical protein [Streptomyces sp. ME12-02E]MDX3336153.1 hypothetical protein [Streptomyces sp. ME02-6978a]